MRISGGQLKGRRTAPQKVFARRGSGSELRPTSSKVREALFDIVRPTLPGAIFLDLYAGTGTVGLEALSRGGARLFLVEREKTRSQSMKSLIEKFGIAGRASVYTMDALDFLRKAEREKIVFDIIFADPPYGSAETEGILAFVDRTNVLRPGGVTIVEHSVKSSMGAAFDSLRFVKNYRYGDTMLDLYRKEE